MEQKLDSIQESLDFIIAHMATKDDIVEVKTEIKRVEVELRTELKEIRDELHDIRNRLYTLESSAENQAGFTKEIDHAFQRIAAIEKHLGITAKEIV